MSLDEELARSLGDLESRGLLRKARDVSGPQGPEIQVDGHQVICLCSNNYLGLASHPALVDAARMALASEGLGSGASRLISGNMHSHRALEARLASFLREQAAILFATGYAANVGTLSALAGDEDIIFSDELNHASIIDGCQLSKARIRVYRHRDTDHLAELLATERPTCRRAIVVSDAIFSMDGDVAPLSKLRSLCDAADAWLMVDEAHSLGVVGPSGRGMCAEAGLRADVFVGTLGKALGCAGAFVAGRAPLIRYLENRARSYVFSTAPPPAIAAAALRAVDLVAEGDELRDRLHRHARRLREGLREQGWEAGGDDTPIVPILVGHPDSTMRISQTLFEAGVFAHGIRPPTVPAGTSRIRVVPTASHEDEHIERALEAFGKARSRAQK